MTTASQPHSRRFYVIGFLVLMAFDTLAQLSFKVAGDHALPLEFSPAWLARVFGQPWIYGAFIGYVGAFFTWMTLLKHAPIGPAFAASHLEIVSVLVLSALLFGEHIGWQQMLGGLFILAGIVCLAFSEEEAGAPEATQATPGNAAGLHGAAH
ncbi:MAG: EamA family transporter [Rhodoferax sp.]|nr:EamA family transporter [Rhodoferax sp.]